MIRAVLDANVFVSAVLSPRGNPAKILTAWRAERFHLVTSPPILEEIDRVFRYPKIVPRHRWPEETLRAFIDDLAHLAILTPGERTLKVIAEDPSDDRYIMRIAGLRLLGGGSGGGVMANAAFGFLFWTAAIRLYEPREVPHLCGHSGMMCHRR